MKAENHLAPLSPARQRNILDGAAAVFTRDGYEGASMSQIAAQAGVSKGTLYNYFPGKQALFTAFVREGCTRLLQDVFGELSPEAPPEAALTKIGGTMLRSMLSPRGMAMFRVVVMEASKFPELSAAFLEAGPKMMVGRLAAWLEAQTASGRLRTVEPLFAAEQFFALTQAGLVLRARADAGFSASEAEMDRVVAGAVAVFLAAYRAP